MNVAIWIQALIKSPSGITWDPQGLTAWVESEWWSRSSVRLTRVASARRSPTPPDLERASPRQSGIFMMPNGKYSSKIRLPAATFQLITPAVSLHINCSSPHAALCVSERVCVLYECVCEKEREGKSESCHKQTLTFDKWFMGHNTTACVSGCASLLNLKLLKNTEDV